MSANANKISLTIARGRGDVEESFPPDMTVGALKQPALNQL
jgi:hypothetical protein